MPVKIYQIARKSKSKLQTFLEKFHKENVNHNKSANKKKQQIYKIYKYKFNIIYN